MDHKQQLLAYIVEASEPNTNPQNPYGFCYIEAGHEPVAVELHNASLIQALVTQRAADGSIPVRPTEEGVKAVKAPKPVQAAQHAPQAAGPIKIETGIAIPDKRAFGRVHNGESAVEKYGFDNVPINGSFFIPPGEHNTAEKPIYRTFASTVSQANKKLHPKNFVIREWQENGVNGARVWRTEDLQGERPVRQRKQKASEVQAQPQAGGPAPFAAQGGPTFPGGFPAPGNAAFGAGAPGPQPFGGAPAPFPAPGAFPAPAGAPGGFGIAPMPSQVAWGDSPVPLPDEGE